MKAERVVIAWEGARPIYATPKLLAWREKMRHAREAVEAAREGSQERADAEAAYLAVMAE
jgi:hypothetical protein